MKPLLIVDGYNVLNAWEELLPLKEESLEHAREVLLNLLADYGGCKGYEVMVVYDAHLRFSLPSEEYRAGAVVVFTAAGQTADSYIEKQVYALAKQGREIYVVTSDWAEQLTVLGLGAYRISARELRLMILEARKKREKRNKSATICDRNEIFSRLQPHISEKMDALRKGKTEK